MSLGFPLQDSYHQTQGFGENPATYAQFGMKGHNGDDFACARGTGIYAVDEGFIGAVASDPKGYGNCVVQVVSRDTANAYWYIIYGHMLQYLVKEGDKVTKGQLLGLVDSTGFSTGDHLHFGLRPLEKRIAEAGEATATLLGVNYAIPDYNNGFFGFIDPKPYLNAPVEIFPVDIRYGQEYSALRETYWSTRYNENKVRQEAYAKGYGAVEFARMKNAFIYGYYPKDFVLEVGNFPIWTTMTYPEYQKRQKAGTLLGSASSSTIQPL